MSAKSRRARRQEERSRRVERSEDLAHYVRRKCSSCGSKRLWWGDVETATLRHGSAYAQQALGWLGPDGGAHAQFWGCEDCGEGGAFGLVHEEWDDALTHRLARRTDDRPPA